MVELRDCGVIVALVMAVGLFVVTAPTEADLHFFRGGGSSAGVADGSRIWQWVSGIHGGDGSGNIYGTGTLIGRGIVAS